MVWLFKETLTHFFHLHYSMTGLQKEKIKLLFATK